MASIRYSFGFGANYGPLDVVSCPVIDFSTWNFGIGGGTNVGLANGSWQTPEYKAAFT